MKSLAFITASLSISLTALGILFKMQHWAGASLILTLGFFLVVIASPVVAKYLYDKNK
jgi:hypothetical protein